MGYFKVKQALAISGGSVLLGADTNLYRSAANILATDDALSVGGTVLVKKTSGGTTTIDGGTVTVPGQLVNSGSAVFSGTPFIIPTGGTPTNLRSNGAMYLASVNDVNYLLFRVGGTPISVGLPATTHGTLTITVNSLPS